MPVVLDGVSMLMFLSPSKVYVDLPSEEARVRILETHCRKLALGDSVNLDSIGRDQRCLGFSGADLAGLVREAATCALRRLIQEVGRSNLARDQLAPKLQAEDFDAAFKKSLPSVSRKDLARYRKMRTQLRKSRARIDDMKSENPQTQSPEEAGSLGDAKDIPDTLAE